MGRVVRYAVGIDAGKTTGVALLDLEEDTFVDFFTTTFWGVYHHRWKEYEVTPDTATYVIERPRKGFVYQSHGKQKPLVMNNIAFKAGENNRESSLLVEAFTDLGYEVEVWTPRSKKWSHSQLSEIVDVQDKTNEHVRDAIKILWERFYLYG